MLKCFMPIKNNIEKDKRYTNATTNIVKYINSKIINRLKREIILDNDFVNVKACDEDSNSNILYVILPYFNFCKSKRRYELFIEFIERISKYDKIKIVISEASNTDTFELPDNMDNIYQHHGYKLQTEFWCKENLINVAIRNLPSQWKYVAWIDADLTFLNENWVEEALEELDKAHFIQLYTSAVYLGPQEEAMRIDKSFGYMYKNSTTEWRNDHKYGFWHCGFAWACTRYAYDKTNGLIDFAILGSSDHHMALALINKVELSYPNNTNIDKSFLEKLKDYEALVRIHKLNLSYINGTILHHWHGRLEDRKYVERWNIFYKHSYNPDKDIVYNDEGLINLTAEGKRMEQDIIEYFIGRNEDNTEV